MLGRYAPFIAVCVGYAVLVLWLVARRRLQLQHSLLYLSLMVAFGAAVLSVVFVPTIVTAMGFALPANLLFTCALGVLGVLHLFSLIHISQLQDRSIRLLQEVALLQQQIDSSRFQTRESSSPPGAQNPQAQELPSANE